jgi:hypothetical protein
MPDDSFTLRQADQARTDLLGGSGLMTLLFLALSH